MDYTAWRFWFDAAQVIATILIGLYVWWTNREKVNAKRFAALETKVAERLSIEAHQAIDREQTVECSAHRRQTEKTAREVQRIETEIKHLPSSRDYAEINGKLENIAGSLNGLRRAVDLMNEHLINQGGK